MNNKLTKNKTMEILEQLKNIQELATRLAQDAEGIQRLATSAILNWDEKTESTADNKYENLNPSDDAFKQNDD